MLDGDVARARRCGARPMLLSCEGQFEMVWATPGGRRGLQRLLLRTEYSHGAKRTRVAVGKEKNVWIVKLVHWNDVGKASLIQVYVKNVMLSSEEDKQQEWPNG